MVNATLLLEEKLCLFRPREDGRSTTSRSLQLVAPTEGFTGVHLASAVVAYQDGEPAGVAYRVTGAKHEDRVGER